MLAYIRYLSSFATVVVPDLDGAASWYGSAFGFGLIARDPHGNGEAPAVHLRRGEGQDLILVAGHVDQPPLPESAAVRLNLAIDGELSRFVEHAVANGAEVVGDAQPGKGGATEVTLRDPYGHVWTFFLRSVPGVANFASRVHH